MKSSVGEILEREVRAPREPVARGQGGRHLLVQQGMHGQPLRIDETGTDEGDVEPLVAHRRQQVARAALFQHEGDVGSLAAELADGACDQRMERRRGREAHGDAAGLAARGAAGLHGGAFDRGQDRLGIGQEGTAGIGQADAARMAQQQRRADLALQRPDLLAERRLLHVQLLGRARDMAFVRDGDEVAEVSQFHLAYPISIKDILSYI